MQTVPIDRIKIGKYRVRTNFDEEKMQTLVQSIKRRGIMYPIVVKPLGQDFELIAGERRLRAAKEAGIKDVPILVRKELVKDNGLIEMGIETIQREDLSFYERGRWVSKMKELGWTVVALSEETGITRTALQQWYDFYKEAEKIKEVSTVDTSQLPLRGLLEVRRAPIPEEKKTELAVEVSKMPVAPSVTEIQRATRLIEQEPTLPATEALERAKGITLLLPIPLDLMSKLKDYASEHNLSIQDAIIEILRLYLE